jgi:hypothetical protein
MLYQHVADYQTFRRYELLYSHISLQQKILVCLHYHTLNIERHVIRYKNDINHLKSLLVT